MDERLRLLNFIWILACGCCGAALGALFGGLAGALYWQSGRTSGSRIGHRVAQMFETAAGRELAHATKGGLVGAVDGAVFLGVIGTLFSMMLVYEGVYRRILPSFVEVQLRGRPTEEILYTTLLVVAGLLAGATFFGLLAYTLTRAGVWALALAACTGMLGVAVGARVAGVGGILFGAVIGLTLGNLLSLLFVPRRM